jgi:hypothetical protein
MQEGRKRNVGRNRASVRMERKRSEQFRNGSSDEGREKILLKLITLVVVSTLAVSPSLFFGTI